MRGIDGILSENSCSAIVMREAIKNNDFNTVDLLSCGSGYDVSEEEMMYYLENGEFVLINCDHMEI